MFFLHMLPAIVLVVVLGAIMVPKTMSDARRQAAASDAAGDVIVRERVDWKPWRALAPEATRATATLAVLNEDDPAFMDWVAERAMRMNQRPAQA